ncbi:MAG: DUF3108 domain-containing protein [Myxococcota bacterium]
MWLMMMLGGALAGELDGERLTWSLSFAGITAGEAWATVKPGPTSDQQIIEAGARNADWYGAIYSIDDFIRSTGSLTSGSVRYETRFREGGFQQDQDMTLSPEGITVWRNQKFKEGWREWTKTYPAAPGAADPLSALYMLRRLEGEGPWVLPVFSGEETWPLEVELLGREVWSKGVMGPVTVRVLSLRTLHEGDWEQRGKFLVYVTEDAHRVPARVVIKLNVGAIRAELIAHTPPFKE